MGEQEEMNVLQSSSPVRSLEIIYDDDNVFLYLISGHMDGTIKFWSLDDDDEAEEVHRPQGLTERKLRSLVASIKFRPGNVERLEKAGYRQEEIQYAQYVINAIFCINL